MAIYHQIFLRILTMNKERLQAVIDAIENQSKKENFVFKMSTWAQINCNTSACAIGCYCLANPDSELKLVEDGSFTQIINGSEIRVIEMSPRYNNMLQWPGIAAYFDISEDDAVKLFGNFHRSAEEEIDIIKTYINVSKESNG